MVFFVVRHRRLFGGGSTLVAVVLLLALGLGGLLGLLSRLLLLLLLLLGLLLWLGPLRLLLGLLLGLSVLLLGLFGLLLGLPLLALVLVTVQPVEVHLEALLVAVLDIVLECRFEGMHLVLELVMLGPSQVARMHHMGTVHLVRGQGGDLHREARREHEQSSCNGAQHHSALEQSKSHLVGLKERWS